MTQLTTAFQCDINKSRWLRAGERALHTTIFAIFPSHYARYDSDGIVNRYL